MPNIPQIKIGNTTYSIKDEVARSQVFVGTARNVENTLVDSTDLDNVTEVGTYKATSDASAATMLHCPVSNAFSMFVYQAGATSYVGQMIYSSMRGETYFRTYRGGTWSSWAGRVEEDNIIAALKNIWSDENCIVWSGIQENQRLQVSNGGMTSATNQFVTNYIPIREGMVYTLNATLASGTYGNVFYDYNKNVISTVSGTGGYYQHCVAPANAAYVRFTIQNDYLTNHTAIVKVTAPQFENLARAMGAIVETTKWLAIGDSITYGVYSYISQEQIATSGVTTNCWVRLLANALNYDLTIMASRGMGYTVTGQDPLDSTQPRITISELLTRIEALTDDFNLITLAFGINDYNTDTSTISDIEESLDSALQRLVTKFPNARLVVITPFNECRQGSSSTNYAYNATYGGRTLKDIADAIKARCTHFGVECLYASNGFIFNDFNIVGLQPDTVHPSLTGHTIIAKNMAHTLLY